MICFGGVVFFSLSQFCCTLTYPNDSWLVIVLGGGDYPDISEWDRTRQVPAQGRYGGGGEPFFWALANKGSSVPVWPFGMTSSAVEKKETNIEATTS